jgi:hypothetical protein
MTAIEMRWIDWRENSAVFGNFMPLLVEKISEIVRNCFGRIKQATTMETRLKFPHGPPK